MIYLVVVFFITILLSMLIYFVKKKSEAEIEKTFAEKKFNDIVETNDINKRIDSGDIKLHKIRR